MITATATAVEKQFIRCEDSNCRHILGEVKPDNSIEIKHRRMRARGFMVFIECPACGRPKMLLDNLSNPVLPLLAV